MRALALIVLGWGFSETLGDEQTCGDLQDVFVASGCCGSDAGTPIFSPPSAPVAETAWYVGCNTSMVGAGTGGLYTAFRMVEDADVSASSICIFEGDSRIGGRILSLRNQAATP